VRLIGGEARRLFIITAMPNCLLTSLPPSLPPSLAIS